MKAVIFRTFGAADILEMADVPMPNVPPDGVLTRVAAAGVNPADWRYRNGQFKMLMRSRMPFTPGADIAGIVEAVGAAVTRFHKGERVYAMLPLTHGGGYAEYATVTESALAHVPGYLSLSEAAAIPLTGLTALQALRDKADLQAGQHILINGASGGVGTFAIQIAKAMGAHVTAVCSERNFDFVRSLGADAVRDYQHDDLAASGERYDVVFDAMDKIGWQKAGQLVRRGGLFVSVNPVLGIPPLQLITGLNGWRIRSLLVKPSGIDLETLNTWIAAGKLRVLIDKCFPLSAAADAQRYSETLRVRGKLIVSVDENLAACADHGN